MTNEKYRKLVSLLFSKTMSNEIEWSSSYRNSEYLTSFLRSSIKLSRNDSDDGIITITILNSEGLEVDAFSSLELDPPAKQGGFLSGSISSGSLLGERISWKDRINDLFNLVRRRVLRADEVLDDLIESLSSK